MKKKLKNNDLFNLAMSVVTIFMAYKNLKQKIYQEEVLLNECD